MFNKITPQIPFSAADIRRQLDLVLASSEFKATPQQVQLLKYVVAQVLEGRAEQIKAYTVATEVFGRRSDFDQNLDPIVSIQASRLRRALGHYYASAGQNDRIRIDIPTGTYVPVFAKHRSAPMAVQAATRQEAFTEAGNAWPSVLVRPLKNLSGDPALDAWGLALSTELADELYRYPDIRVTTAGASTPEAVAGRGSVRLVLDGSVRSDRTSLKVIIRLTDTWNARQVWSEAFRSSTAEARCIAYQEQIARVIAVKVAGRQGWIAKTLGRETNHRGVPHSPVYDAVLRYYKHELTWHPENFKGALAALEKAAAVDPDCGQVWSMRARLMAESHALDIDGFTHPLEQAFAFAQSGLRLLPGDQRAHAVMAYVHLLRDDLESGRAEAQQALELGGETLFMLDAIGYLLTLMGDWQRGPALIAKIQRLNPFFSNDVHYALWVSALRQKDHEGARLETMKLNRPAIFWDHLARAATLGLCGQIEAGRRSAAELLIRKPDFPARGRMLIERLIKFDGITARVIKGLAAVGITVA